MTKLTNSHIAAAISALAAVMLIGIAPRSARALEPNNASEIIALTASHPHGRDSPLLCPYNNTAGAFVKIGPNGAESTPFVVPNKTVFVATAFGWQGNGGLPSVWEPDVLAQATVLLPGGTVGRTIIRSSAIADNDQTNEFTLVTAGNWLNIPNGVVLRPSERGPLCLLIQQLNDVSIGTAFLYGFLADDK